MYTLSIELTKLCNLDCKYCYVDKTKPMNTTWEICQKAIDIGMHEAKKQNDRKLAVYFIGGEPLLAFDMIQQCVSYIEEKNKDMQLIVSFDTTTNGTMLSEEKVEYLIEKKFHLKISIDGTEEVHNSNRIFTTGKGSYQSIKENLKYLEMIETGTNTLVHAAQVVSRSTYKNWLDSLENIRSLGFRYIESEVNAEEQWTEDEVKGLLEEIDKVFKYYIHSRNSGEQWFWKYYESQLRNFVSDSIFFPCKAGLVSMFVTVEGKIYPCIEQDEFMQIGDVWNGLNVDRIRQIAAIHESENEKCLQCENYKAYHCKACGCLMLNYERTKDMYTPADIQCIVTKHIFSLFRKLYSKEQIETLHQHYKRGVV